MRNLKKDPRTAPVGPARRAMLDYVNVLTETLWAVTEAHVVAMREQGFSDQAIFEANQIAGFFAWVNRSVEGLGVELEDELRDPDADNL